MTQQISFSPEAYSCFGKQTEFVFSFCLKATGRPSVAVALVDDAAKLLLGSRSFRRAKDHKKGLIGIATVRSLLELNQSFGETLPLAEENNGSFRVVLVRILKLQYLDDAARCCVLMYREGASPKEIHETLSEHVASKVITEPNAQDYIAMGPQGIEALLKTEWAGLIVDVDTSRLKHKEAYNEGS